MQERNEDTHESDALGGEVQFDRADAETIADPAATSVEAEGAALGSAEVEAPGASETASDALHEPLVGDPAGAGADTEGGWEPPGEQSPAAADRRGAEHAESPPFVPIAGAFVGAFVAAKLLGKLGGGND